MAKKKQKITPIRDILLPLISFSGILIYGLVIIVRAFDLVDLVEADEVENFNSEFFSEIVRIIIAGFVIYGFSKLYKKDKRGYAITITVGLVTLIGSVLMKTDVYSTGSLYLIFYWIMIVAYLLWTYGSFHPEPKKK